MGAKINYKIYSVLSVAILSLASFLARSFAEILVMAFVMVAAMLNQWMLVKIVRDTTNNAAHGASSDKFELIMMVLGKVLVLIVALSFGVHLMGTRVIIPVLIYILQIAVLYLSLNKSKTSEGSK